MRKLAMAALGAAAACLIATLIARRATRHGVRAATAQPRPARLEDIVRDIVPPVRFARANSLWGESAMAPCLIGAVWGEQPAQAAFAPQMRLALRAPLRAPALAAGGAIWTARERPELATTGEAEAVARQVALEPGAAPVVRVLKIADFRRKDRPAPDRRYGALRRAA